MIAKAEPRASDIFRGSWMEKPSGTILGMWPAVANFGHLGHPAESVSPRPLADRLGASISGCQPETVKPHRDGNAATNTNTKQAAYK